MYLQGETVYTGNSLETAITTARANYNADGLLQFIDVEGPMFAEGDLVFGEDSGFSARLTGVALVPDIITGQAWDEDFITQDDGSLIALDAYFTGANSQYYQKDNLVVTG